MNKARLSARNSIVEYSSISSILDSKELTALEQALLVAQRNLQSFASEPDFGQKMAIAFGEEANVDSLRTAWSANDFSDFPEIEICHVADINGANGAFAAATNKIYLSQEFIINHQGDVGRIVNVLLEEFGHFVDSQLNEIDTPGDEGGLFSAFVQKQAISFAELASFNSEDDTTVVVIHGQSIIIEQSTTYIGTNLDEVITGLDKLLLKLQEGVNNQVFGAYLPLVGTQLQSNSETQFLYVLRSFIQSSLQKAGSLSAISIQQALTNALGASEANVLLQNITFNETADNLEFDVWLGRASNTNIFNVDLDTKLGLPGLGLTLNGSSQSRLGYKFNLKFGVNKTSGFYFRTDTLNELSAELDTTLPSLDTTAKLGLLNFSAKDSGSKFSGQFTIDLRDNDGKLHLSEIPSVNFNNFIETQFSGSANINLDLKTAFSQTTVLPSFSSDFNLNWNFNGQKIVPGSVQNFGSTPTIAFNNVKLDLGLFLTSYINPILDKIKTITEPILPVLDFLTKEYDLGFTKFSVLDIARSLGQIDSSDQDFIESIAELGRLINNVPSSSLSINLGSFNFGTQDIRTPEFSTTSIIPQVSSTSNLDTELSNDSQAKSFIDRLRNMPGGGLSIPILTDSSAAFGLLLGKNVDLFTYKLPRLDFSLNYEQFFPIWAVPPVGIRLNGEIGAFIDLGFGYDTQGLQDYELSRDQSDIFNGFFVSDPTTPEVGFTMGLEASAELNAVIARAGAGGGIYGKFDFDLNDPNDDNKVRFSEFKTLLNNPKDLFEAKGEVTAGIFAYVSGGIWPLEYTKRFDLGEITLAEFNWGKKVPDGLQLATLSNGTLMLNVGSRASERKVENLTDIAEAFTVKHKDGIAGNENLQVSGLQFTQDYNNIQRISANSGENNDRIILAEGILSPAILSGGNGNDIIYGGSGNDSISGNNDKDNLQGRAGDDTLRGGSGNDYILGNLGRDSLYGDSEDDILDGGEDDDRLFGGAGIDILFGGTGNDSLDGEAGND
ncbi:calcium-binding protein, partial [Nostoc sp. KVJ20]|uniref:calcium-binding protein n=1 Tax=Nostoc sp. KVJ20 TaxID=457944 RepID=UPI00114CA28A